MNTILHLLDAGTKFKGCVRFTNLAPDELGLVLWSLLLNKQSVIQTGMGKPYGYGQMKLDRESVKLLIERPDKKYGSHFTFFNDYTETADPEKYISCFKRYMRDEQKVMIMNEPSVQGFFKMLTNQMKDTQVRYRELKEFKSLDPLPTIDELLTGHIKYFKGDMRKRPWGQQFGNRFRRGSGRNNQQSQNKFRNNRSGQSGNYYSSGGDRHSQIDERWAKLRKLRDKDNNNNGDHKNNR